MPVQETCPTCGGTGVQTLGMTFGEAIDLAQKIGTTGNVFAVRSIEWRAIQNYGAWIVRAGHMPSGGTIVTFKGPEFYEREDWMHWNPLGKAEG